MDGMIGGLLKTTSSRLLLLGCIAAIAIVQLSPVAEPMLPDDAPKIPLTPEQLALSPEELSLLALEFDTDWAKDIALNAPLTDARGLLAAGFPRVAVDQLVAEYCRRKPNVFVAVLSPRARQARREVHRMLRSFGNIIYDKPLSLTGDAPRKLLIKMYSEFCDRPHPWVKREAAMQQHLSTRFGVDAPAWLFVFEAPSLAHARAWKRHIRRMTGVGTVGLHVTDTHTEAVRLAELLLDESAVKNLGNKT